MELKTERSELGEKSSEESESKSNLMEKEKKKKKGMNIEGYQIEGLSIAGHETCVILPTLNLAFDIGKCPQRAISQQFLFISHGHMDHIGGLPMYVATRGLYRMKPPTIIVPNSIKENVEKIFEAHRAMDQSELKHVLVGLNVGEEFYLRSDLKVRAFRTYHVIPSQGYIIYSVRKKLKPEYSGLPGDKIKHLKSTGVEITYSIISPEVAFTGDTTSDFIVDDANVDVLRAKILIMESTFVENTMTVEDARECGHAHLFEIVSNAERFQNKAILLIHFSARYQLDEIENAISKLQPPLAGRVFALTEGMKLKTERSELSEKPNEELESKSNLMERKKKKGMNIEGYQIEGLSIAGHETCVILPTLNLAFDIGKCPQRAISQQFLFISHGHMDHIGGLPMYVATCGLYRMKPPTIIVPNSIKENVEKIFEAHRAMNQSELKHVLIGLNVGEEFYLRSDLKVRAFRTYHVIPSQGYIIYSVRKKLKPEFSGLPGDKIKHLKSSGVEITYSIISPEVAFTGDTTSDFIVDDANVDVLRAKILIMESTFVENTMTVEDAREYGHTHLSEIVSNADRFQNKAILLIHFSARYQLDEIENAISKLQPPLAGRVFALTEGF